MSRRTLFLLLPDETVSARLAGLEDEWDLRQLARPGDIGLQPPGSMIVVDTACRNLPSLGDPLWRSWSGHQTLIVASSAPTDEEGLAALEAGASGYCHTYAAEGTWRQVLAVVASGELWVGRSLMSRLLRGIRPAKPVADGNWRSLLTDREQEVAQRAALGESNLSIASALGITERTVKAHLTTIFEKTGVTDRLQLALKVHGIR